MDHAAGQDAHQSKGPMLRHREHGNDSADMRPTDNTAFPAQDEMRPIRRLHSPSRQRTWISNSYKPKFASRSYRPRDEYSFYKPGFSHQRYHQPSYFQRKDHFHPKPHHIALREREREKERYEQRESSDSSLLKQNNATQASLPRSTSSRDKDMQFIVCQRNQSWERDHRGTKSKERERSRDGELPSTVSQTVARDRAIQQKRREINEVYYQECEMFGLVAKMLIAKDQSLEVPIQSSLKENLRDIGKRCVEAMEKFIEDYDSGEQFH